MNRSPSNPPPSDIEARLATWLEEGPTSGPDEVLSRAFARARSTRQDRAPLHRLTHPTRSNLMNSMLKFAAVAVFALAVGVALGPFVTSGPDIASAPVPSLSPAPVALGEGSLAAGNYSLTPYVGPGSSGVCQDPPQEGCVEMTTDAAVSFTFGVPDGWVGTPPDGISGDGAALIFARGADLYDDPCTNDGTPEIPVGSSVEGFVDALVAHPLLKVSSPTEVSLGGYRGQYLELQVPDDLSGCAQFRPWEPWYFAQDAGERWHLWVLDVDGVRVLIQGIDHADTAPDRQAELIAIVDSIRIVAPTPYSEPATLAAGTYVLDPREHADWTPARFTFDLPAGWASRNGIISKDRTGPGEVAFSTWIIDNMYVDPCRWQDSLRDPPLGPTVDDLATALGGQIGREASAPDDVTLSGYPAQRIELSVPADLDVSTCDKGTFRVWLESGERHTDAPILDGDIPALVRHAPGQRDVVYIADLDGERFVLSTWHMPGSSAEDLAELDAIVASIRIDPPTIVATQAD